MPAKKSKQKPVIVSSLAAVAAKDYKVSITFQAMKSLKQSLGKIASSLGLTRMKDGARVSALTPIIVLLLEYGVAHQDQAMKWLSNGKKDIAGKEKSA